MSNFDEGLPGLIDSVTMSKIIDGITKLHPALANREALLKKAEAEAACESVAVGDPTKTDVSITFDTVFEPKPTLTTVTTSDGVKFLARLTDVTKFPDGTATAVFEVFDVLEPLAARKAWLERSL